MDKKLSGFIIGKPKVSEFSNEVVLSEKDKPIVLRIYGKDVDIDIDNDNNLIINNINSLIMRGKDMIEEFESSDETYSKDKTIKCLKYFLESLESISIVSKQILLSSKQIQINASEKLELFSKDIKLGSLETTELPDDEENYDYDYVLTQKKFGRWWKNIIKPFIDKITDLENKYNNHRHNVFGNITGSASEISINTLLDFESVNESASTTESLVSSQTTKTI